MEIDNPILITGAARSGTSLTAGIIHICGAWGGKMAGPTMYNKRGMFENSQIRQQLIKPFLRSINCDPLGQRPLPNTWVVRKIALSSYWRWRLDVIQILNSQGYKGNKKWMYKGAKMCLMWPMWHLAFQKAIWVIVRRDKDDIVYSCLKTGFMRKCENRKGWEDWVDCHLDKFKEMEAVGLKIYEIWPQKIINGDLSEIRQLIDQLGLKWENDKVMAFIEPALWSGKAKIKKGVSNDTQG